MKSTKEVWEQWQETKTPALKNLLLQQLQRRRCNSYQALKLFMERNFPEINFCKAGKGLLISGALPEPFGEMYFQKEDTKGYYITWLPKEQEPEPETIPISKAGFNNYCVRHGIVPTEVRHISNTRPAEIFSDCIDSIPINLRNLTSWYYYEFIHPANTTLGADENILFDVHYENNDGTASEIKIVRP